MMLYLVEMNKFEKNEISFELHFIEFLKISFLFLFHW